MKNYYLSNGNNLGQNREFGLVQNHDMSDYFFRGNISSVIDVDSSFRFAVLRTTNYYSVLKNNKEFNSWAMSEEGKSATTEEYRKKLFAALPKEYMEYCDVRLTEFKERYKNFFQQLEGCFQELENSNNNNQVDLSGGVSAIENRQLLLHTIPIPTNVDGVQSRKDLGILPSEWFGKLEEYSECRFCASFTKINGFKKEEDKWNEKSLTFILDAEAGALKNILKIDYFQYLRNKQENNLDGYTAMQIEFLKTLEQFSNHKIAEDVILKNLSGKSNGGVVAMENQDWVALPAGVPSKYVVGIMCKGLNKSDKQFKIVEEISKIFGVPIVNSMGEIVFQPNQEKGMN